MTRSKWVLVLPDLHDQGKTIFSISENLTRNSWHVRHLAALNSFSKPKGQDWNSKLLTSRLPVFDFVGSSLTVEMGRMVVNGNHRRAVCGEIADIRFFDRPLDQLEILSLANGVKRPEAIALSFPPQSRFDSRATIHE
jgi:hypothetical protein